MARGSPRQRRAAPSGKPCSTASLRALRRAPTAARELLAARHAHGSDGLSCGDRLWSLAMTESAIELERVTKMFGPRAAVEGVDLRVPRGSLYGFIGPNGSGKTTTLRLILRILLPTSGRV